MTDNQPEAAAKTEPSPLSEETAAVIAAFLAWLNDFGTQLILNTRAFRLYGASEVTAQAVSKAIQYVLEASGFDGKAVTNLDGAIDAATTISFLVDLSIAYSDDTTFFFAPGSMPAPDQVEELLDALYARRASTQTSTAD